MKAVFVEQGQVRLRSDLPRPQTAEGECRVAVEWAGVCATDLALTRGYMGFSGVPGHEFVGVAQDGPLAGQRVVGEINAGCGVCSECRGGDPRHCAQRSVLGILGRPGAFSEELCLPACNLHVVPSGLDPRWATFTEPVAAAFQLVEQVEVDPGTPVLVQGDGRLGLLCAQVLARSGAEVDLLGRHPERGSFLPSNVRYIEASAARRYPLVVEATGRTEALAGALARTAPRGTLMLKTTTESAVPLDLAPLVVDEIRLVGSRCGPFAPALAALAAGEVVVEPMIEATYPLEQTEAALSHAGSGGVLKVLIEVGGDLLGG